ncbi:hypothetical protein CEXT_373141 [Caerostris extrusa]|uniref:Uncharacterized protein n=1 Tax=Caerostris extrusa TaxID=172846 RepID=A0AAV4UBJ2_CAEEX|nr:hypothetical protein CEXT_373141 [Caerostris extrusa]
MRLRLIRTSSPLKGPVKIVAPATLFIHLFLLQAACRCKIWLQLSQHKNWHRFSVAVCSFYLLMFLPYAVTAAFLADQVNSEIMLDN